MKILLLATVALGPGPQVGLTVPRPEAARADTLEFGRPSVESLEFSPLEFDPPAVGEYEVLGVPVFHLQDSTLPLVDFQLLIRGGIANFGRERFASGSALPFVLRSGGTTSLSPDSVDRRVDRLALDLSVGTSGGAIAVSLNVLTDRLDPALDLLREILLEPAFDSDAVEVWRDQAAERIRRREDNAADLALTEFNRLMYGDHPVGWVMEEADLAPERLSGGELRELHADLFCRERLILGVSGDADWETARVRLVEFLDAWPSCSRDLADPPPPVLRDVGGLFIIEKNIEQSTIVMASSSSVTQADDPDYFAARVANHLLGGRGFTSRLMARLRTVEGLAYSAASVWTTPLRYEGIVGAMAATRVDRTMEATRSILEVLDGFGTAPPTPSDVDQAIREIQNGYVFAFESPSQIVSRRMVYRAQEMPAGWLSRYLQGLREVTAASVESVVREQLDAQAMTILLVGPPGRFDSGIEDFDQAFSLATDGSVEPWRVR